MSPEPGDPAALRVSDVEREQVQQFLARAMVAGQITAGEYSERSAAALAARFRRDLEGLLDDLPGADLHVSRSVDVLDLQAGVGGAISRRGYWRVPPLVRVRSWVGGVTLDFSGAEFTTLVVAVELATGMCSPVLVLPEHATADVDDLRIAAGKVRDDIHHRRERGVPHPGAVLVRPSPVGEALGQPALDPARRHRHELGLEGVVQRVGEHVGQGLDEPVGALGPVHVQHARTSPCRLDLPTPPTLDEESDDAAPRSPVSLGLLAAARSRTRGGNANPCPRDTGRGTYLPGRGGRAATIRSATCSARPHGSAGSPCPYSSWFRMNPWSCAVPTVTVQEIEPSELCSIVAGRPPTVAGLNSANCRVR